MSEYIPKDTKVNRIQIGDDVVIDISTNPEWCIAEARWNAYEPTLIDVLFKRKEQGYGEEQGQEHRGTEHEPRLEGSL